MNPTNQNSEPASENQQSPATGIPVISSNQQYCPPTQNYPKLAFRHQPAIGTGKALWSTGLYDCCSDVPNCCITCWCPCITFGQIAEIIDQGNTSCALNGALYGLLGCFTGCACNFSWFYRARMRGQFTLQESPCCDCCVHFCCETCALCQEYRELRNRGFDMSLGWHGNLQRMHSRGSTTSAPEVESGIER